MPPPTASTDTMSNPECLTLDRYPEPACSYVFDSGAPVVRSHNDAFERLCGRRTGDEIEGLFVSEFEEVGTVPSFERTERCWVQPGANTESYLVRVIPPEDEAPGHLLFTASEGRRQPQEFGVDRVASVVSHDLRNPLDVARARLRAGRELDEDEHFDHVEQAHDRMERIIQDVLTLARGEDVVTPDESVDLGQIAEQAWQTVETNGATLDVNADLPTTVADEARVSRLFENLFRNSIEHGSPNSNGPHEITVTVGTVPDGFYVADNGRGIPPSDRQKVFKAGYTSDDHGTGLGLAIVERIADLHGWSVTVTEASCGGARFEFGGVDSE